MGRKYSDYTIKKVAAIILMETTDNEEKRSIGWGGSEQDLNELKRILRGYNVYYTCDFTGVWTHKPKTDYIG